MPIVFRYRGFRFHFYSTEGDPREPIHILVRKNDADATFWLSPVISVAYNRGFGVRDLADLMREADSRRTEIERAWHEHFG